jgi:AcrR family transcriptional regulator
VDDVAALAGVGKATVYRRWPSKEDLAVAAMETLFAVEMPESDTGSIRGDLIASYRAVLAFVNTAEGAAFIRTSVVESVRDERIAALYRSSTERREDMSRATFERAIERGELRADIDVETAVQWLGGLLVARAITQRAMPGVEQAEALADFTLHGLLADER